MAIISFFIYASIKGTAYDKESKAWVDNEVPKIVSNWNSNELIDHSSPELLVIMNKDQANAFIASARDGLGSMKKYNGSTGESGIHINNGKQTISAEYVAKADFEKGSADIDIRLLKEGGIWKILYFHIQQPN
ncbi:MAG: hypothetical protein ABIT47_02825 [Candidatus Paceibacterota bacterium]